MPTVTSTQASRIGIQIVADGIRLRLKQQIRPQDYALDQWQLIQETVDKYTDRVTTIEQILKFEGILNAQVSGITSGDYADATECIREIHKRPDLKAYVKTNRTHWKNETARKYGKSYPSTAYIQARSLSTDYPKWKKAAEAEVEKLQKYVKWANSTLSKLMAEANAIYEQRVPKQRAPKRKRKSDSSSEEEEEVGAPGNNEGENPSDASTDSVPENSGVEESLSEAAQESESDSEIEGVGVRLPQHVSTPKPSSLSSPALKRPAKSKLKPAKRARKRRYSDSGSDSDERQSNHRRRHTYSQAKHNLEKARDASFSNDERLVALTAVYHSISTPLRKSAINAVPKADANPTNNTLQEMLNTAEGEFENV